MIGSSDEITTWTLQPGINMHSSHRKVLTCLRIALLASIAIYLSGCSLLGAALYKVMPEEKAAAVYVPPKDNMLVLVENYRNPASMQIVSELLDRQVTYQLVQHHVAPIINPDRLIDYRQANSKKFSSMQIAAIGKALGAKQVLYADLIEFKTEGAIGAGMAKGQGEMHVKVIDVATGEVRWPQDIADGYPVTVETPYIPLREGASERTVQEQVAQKMSDGLARLFYGAESDRMEPHAPIAPVAGE